MADPSPHAHYSDANLLAWLDGNNEYGHHIEHCEACCQRALLLQIEERRLHSLLFRADCPPPLTLAEYALEQLPEEERERIRLHVARCPHCRQELAWLQQSMAEFLPPATAAPPPPPQQSEEKAGVRVIVARWVNQAAGGLGRGMGMQPVMGAMRGSAQQPPMIFQAEELQITLAFYEDPQHPGRQQLVGLLVGDDAPERFRVQLWREDAWLTEIPVDELGNFAIDDLPPAVYDLKLIHPKLEVQLNALDI